MNTRIKTSLRRPANHLELAFIALALACFGVPPEALAKPTPTPTPSENRGNGNSAAENVDALNIITTGLYNTAHGWHSLSANTAGTANTANGFGALLNNTTGSTNTATGVNALLSNSNGDTNTATGVNSLYNNTSGVQNTATGGAALYYNSTGNYNTAEGVQALEQNTTGSNNTAGGFRALYSNSADNNTAYGYQALLNNTTGSLNAANGFDALSNNTTGSTNTATGSNALYNNMIGNNNTANGSGALGSNTTGGGNTAVGTQALVNNTTGNANIALGYLAGSYLTMGRYNIDIGSPGSAIDDHTIRVGQSQTATYIAGISGQTASGGVVVYVDIDGKLGTATSSARFKDQIKPMDKASEAILALKPVTFRYKKEIDSKGIPQFGLVAEQVEKVNSDLVVRDKEGKPYTVRYEAVNAMLLNEFLKEHKRVEQLETIVAQQRNGMEVLARQIKEQTTQIQKVTAQIEMSRPASRVVAKKP